MRNIEFGDARLTQRFWTKVAVHLNGCWMWTAAKDRKGYGTFHSEGTMRRAHRVAFKALVGAIPNGLVLRHDCDTPACVNPNHLRTGTLSENSRDCVERGRHFLASRVSCPQGHPYSEDNTYVQPKGRRTCRACQREAVRRYKLRKTAALEAEQ